jgi:glycosyltransferase involved in cell wall biosynthesis
MIPKVSFLMTTYGRAALEPRLIEEAVYSVLTQTDRRLELVIANDCPDQRIVCDADARVRAVNFAPRFPTWGDKLNAALALCRGSIVLPMDDDDVSLPHRAAQAIAMLRSHDYWNPHEWWATPRGLDPDPILVPNGIGCGWNCSAVRREKFLGHFSPAYAEADQRAHEWAAENLRTNPAELHQRSDLSYVYRWGVSSQHFSGSADLRYAYENMRPGPPGEYRVVPRQWTDWPAVVRRRLGG